VASAAPAQDGWAVLAEARTEFERAAWTADFVQTYLPAGFSISLELPGKLRWDYDLPYAKVFLVRGDVAYSWNPGETTGRRVSLASQEREHLALLELDLAVLETRYGAVLAETSDGEFEVALSPLDETSEIRSALLTLDASTRRLLTVAYSDFEGNTTEFELSGHRMVAEPGFFSPPADLDWLDD
jgi:outer membrane lipoprotein-sorting protein